MSQVSNVADIAFSTAFLTDKICGVLTGSYSAASANYLAPSGGGTPLYQYAIPHSFKRPVMCEGLYSSDNSRFIPMGQSGPGGSSNPLNVYSDSNYIYILSLQNVGTQYYKIICTWIDDYDATNPLITPVLQTTGSAYFDTRQNYQKILSSGVVSVSNPGVGNTGTHTIAHNLGYAPDYKLFFESLPNQVWPQINGGAQDTWIYNYNNQYELFGIVDDNNLVISYDGGNSSAASLRIWYKIYYDH